MPVVTRDTCTCYACGRRQTKDRMQPFGRTFFGEPVTWVCRTCAAPAPQRATNPSHEPTLMEATA